MISDMAPASAAYEGGMVPRAGAAGEEGGPAGAVGSRRGGNEVGMQCGWVFPTVRRWDVRAPWHRARNKLWGNEGHVERMRGTMLWIHGHCSLSWGTPAPDDLILATRSEQAIRGHVGSASRRPAGRVCAAMAYLSSLAPSLSAVDPPVGVSLPAFAGRLMHRADGCGHWKRRDGRSISGP